jgi:hypothetical protein
VSTQPEALRLADLLTAIAEDPMWSAHGEISKSAALRIAAKLRRLHAVNAELLQALKLALSAHGRMLMSDPPQDAWKAYGVEEKARAAIAKAEEVKP